MPTYFVVCCPVTLWFSENPDLLRPVLPVAVVVSPSVCRKGYVSGDRNVHRRTDVTKETREVPSKFKSPGFSGSQVRCTRRTSRLVGGTTER